jgi:hypothetical protein
MYWMVAGGSEVTLLAYGMLIIYFMYWMVAGGSEVTLLACGMLII